MVLVFFCRNYSQDLRSAARNRLFACGSMVLAIVSVFRFLRSASAKNETQKKMKYRCERSHLGYRVSPVIKGLCSRRFMGALEGEAIPTSASMGHPRHDDLVIRSIQGCRSALNAPNNAWNI